MIFWLLIVPETIGPHLKILDWSFGTCCIIDSVTRDLETGLFRLSHLSGLDASLMKKTTAEPLYPKLQLVSTALSSPNFHVIKSGFANLSCNTFSSHVVFLFLLLYCCHHTWSKNLTLDNHWWWEIWHNFWIFWIRTHTQHLRSCLSMNILLWFGICSYWRHYRRRVWMKSKSYK